MSGKELLQKTTIKQLIEEDPKFELVTVPATATFLDVLSTLGKYKISAAPVVDPATNAVVGCVDVIDLLCFASFELDETTPSKVGLKIREFSARTARDILNFSGRNPWNDLSYKAHFGEVLDLLSETRAHRVAITNEQIDIIGLITQSRIVRFFSQNKESFKDIFSKTVQQVWGERSEKGVLSVHHNDFVINALKIMREKRVSGLAIIDEHGKLVGNISAGDLKNFDPTLEGLREDLHAQIRSFKGIVSGASSTLAHLPHFDPISVSKSATLGDIVELILKNRIHRIFVVDAEGKPTHVISLGDLIKALKTA